MIYVLFDQLIIFLTNIVITIMCDYDGKKTIKIANKVISLLILIMLILIMLI